MSRSSTLPSISSSRQMMMAWKVSGLSHRPAIIASRPASMRLAMAISPSRDSSSTEPISRRYMRTGSSVRSVGSRLGLGARRRAGGGASTRSPPSGSSSSAALLGLGLLLDLGLLGLDDVDAHLVEHGEDVLDLLGGDLLGRQHLVQLVIGDIAALLGELDHLADGGVREVEQRAVRGIGLLLRSLPLLLRLRHLGRRRQNSLRLALDRHLVSSPRQDARRPPRRRSRISCERLTRRPADQACEPHSDRQDSRHRTGVLARWPPQITQGSSGNRIKSGAAAWFGPAVRSLPACPAHRPARRGTRTAVARLSDRFEPTCRWTRLNLP